LDVVNSTGPIVIQNQFFSSLTNITLSRKNFMIMLGLYMANSTYLDDPDTYYSVKSNQYHFYYQKNAEGVPTIVLNRSEVLFVDCDLAAVSQFYNELKDVPIAKFKCFHPDTSVMMMNPFANIGENSYVNVFFSLCSKETVPSGKTCKSMNEINAAISSYNVRVGISDFYTDHNNYTYPIQSYLSQVGSSGSLLGYYRSNNYFGDIIYSTDIGWVFSNIKEEKYFAYQMQVASNDNRPESQKQVPLAFHQITLTYSAKGFHSKFERKY
jgi:hypothetical protein